MATSTNEVKAVLRQGMGPVQADALAAWMEAMQTALAAVAAKLDTDGGVTATNFGTTVSAQVTD